MDSKLLSLLEGAVSAARMQTYRNACTTDEETIVLYLWNLALSASLYSSLSFLEVALRSAIHNVLAKHFPAPWFPRVFAGQALTDYNRLVSNLTFQGAPPLDSQVVANLTFGKWVHLLQNGRCGWVAQPPYRLWGVFPNYSAKAAIERNKIYDRLEYVLGLRNRVMHHEPIFAGVKLPNKPPKPVEEIHADIVQSLGWIDPELQRTAGKVDRFDDVFTTGKADLLVMLPSRYATL